MDDLTKLVDAAAIDALAKTSPGLLRTIRELKARGVAKREIIRRCKAAGARGLVLSCVEAAVEQD